MTSELFLDQFDQLDQLFLSFSFFFTWPTGPNPLSKRAPQANHLFTGVVRYRPEVCVKLHFICTHTPPKENPPFLFVHTSKENHPFPIFGKSSQSIVLDQVMSSTTCVTQWHWYLGSFAFVFLTNHLHIINRKGSLDKQYIQKAFGLQLVQVLTNNYALTLIVRSSNICLQSKKKRSACIVHL